MTSLLNFTILILSVTIFLCVYRAVKGPTISDRIIALNYQSNTIKIYEY